MTSENRGVESTIDEQMASLQRDKKAVYIGTAITTVATLSFFALPEVLARMIGTEGSPVTHVRWFGGVVGGAVAGWLTSVHSQGFITGMKAALYGLGAAYLGAIVLFFFYGIIIAGMFPPPGLAIVALLLLYLLPLLLVHFLGGLIAGEGAQRLRSLWKERPSEP